MNNPSNSGDGVSDAWPKRVAILGVGLLGGSVGLALKKVKPDVEIIGTSRNVSRRDLAVRTGAVDEAVESVADACQQSDVVVVCSPVDKIAPMVIEAARHTPADCLITDVGSTKAGIVSSVAQTPSAMAKFVAAHPIAGSEKTGVENAVAGLFHEKIVILTPSPDAKRQRVDAADRFWQMTGGKIIEMSPEEHDVHLASVSHVPHLVSALVARLAPPKALDLVGTGWRDITRVAAGDPTLWTAIASENRAAISGELAKLAESVDELRRLIDDGSDDDLFRWLSEAKSIKDDASRSH